ncbi:MAG: alpha/beta fold hydrolase [Acidobacteriota bacterium]
MGRRRLRWWLLVAYGLLLAASTVARWRAPEPAPAAHLELTELAVDGTPLRLAWRQWGEANAAAPPLVLLHGSPGSHHDFRRLAPALADDRRVIAADLPGFGASDRRIDDYSVRFQGAAVRALLEHLDIDRYHLAGFSMGGGGVLEIYRTTPERVLSITMIAAIGVQELELLGDYRLNHAVHGLQLAAIQGARWLLPHFGVLDRFPLGYEYARNFYDTDQRPLRGLLETFEPPMLIIHGEHDPLVPAAAAREHHRIVPQSELQMLDTSHFFLFSANPDVAPLLSDFLARVDRGEGRRRAAATAERLAAAGRALDVPRWRGTALWVVLLLLALATLVSEDLTTLGAGLLVAQDRLDFWPAAAACFAGIFIGDLLLFAAGRFLGRPALRLPFLRWWLSEDAVVRSSAWFERRGPAVILLSRFMPGARLPTYFAAGVLRTNAWRFAAYFFVAVALWTPALVALSATLGETALERFGRGIGWAVVALLVFLVILRKLLLPLATWTGRRRLLGTWRRWTRWEFWPPWLFYPPIALYVLGLGLRHRSLTLFTAANPAIPTGGFIGESKSAILQGLAGAGDALPAWRLLPASAPLAERLDLLAEFLERHRLDYPVVLKPDAGQRGTGVAVIRDHPSAAAYLEAAHGDLIVQQYVPGVEIGLFYVRRPDESEGNIFAITEKQLPEVRGDGESTLEELVFADDRAVAMAELYLAGKDIERFEVPAAGEALSLAELGTHCRGAIFLDGGHLASPALRATIDRISQTFEGFYLGRYDLRAASFEAFTAGGPFQVIELNGVTSEATNIYDPRYSVFQAWKILRRQWRLAFEIGAANRRRGIAPASVGELLRATLAYRRGLRRPTPG